MLPSGPFAEKLGFALSRCVVPLWVLLGAGVKLWAGSPNNLPSNFVDFGRSAGIELGFLLYTLIGLEFFAVAVMVMLTRFARPMAIFMLSVFCLVLIGEILKGSESCGCFGGGVPVSPWQMLTIDGILLLAVIAFRPKVPEQSMDFPKAVPVAALLAIGGVGLSFVSASILHRELAQDADAELTEGGTLDPTINPNPRSLPSYWYPEDLDSWVGRPWREATVFQFMRRWPADLDEGKHYIVFYSRTCSHCRDMFEFDLAFPMQAPVVAIEIPYGRQRMHGPNPLFDPREEADENVTHMELPLGPDWGMVTAPLAIRIEDGIIRCANEGTHEVCFELAE